MGEGQGEGEMSGTGFSGNSIVNDITTPHLFYLFPVHFFLMTKVFQLRLQGRELVFFSSVRANALALPIFPLIPHPQITGFRFDENTKKGQG